MKIVMDIPLSGGSHGICTMRKEIESNIVPFPGMYIEDSAWKEAELPVRITCSFGDNYYHVQFALKTLSSQQAWEQEINMYGGHSWKPANEWPLH